MMCCHCDEKRECQPDKTINSMMKGYQPKQQRSKVRVKVSLYLLVFIFFVSSDFVSIKINFSN